MTSKLCYIVIVLFFYFPCSLFGQDADLSLNKLNEIAICGEGNRQTNAQNELGKRYESGTGGVEKDLSKAYFWYKRAALNNNKYAMYNLSMCYLHSKGVKYDKEQAIYWMEKSAQHYFPLASLTAGKWFYDVGFILITPNYTKAAKYLKDAAFGGQAEGMYYYGECFALEYGVSLDFSKSSYWAWRAIEKGCYKGYNLLGRIFRDERFIKNNLEVSISFYEEGIKHNDCSCMVELGDMYYFGNYLKQDINKGIKYFHEAAKRNYELGMLRLFVCYFYGDKVEKDFEKAIYWGKCLYDKTNNNYYAERLLFIYNKLKKYDLAVKMCLELIKKGNPDGYIQLARYYADGKVLPQDYCNKQI